MRDRDQDEAWIRDTVKQAGVEELVYITPNHYDGGYEVRVGTVDVFVEYQVLDTHEVGWLKKFYK